RSTDIPHTYSRSPPARSRKRSSLRPSLPNDRLDRLKHDQQVQPKRHGLDVIQIVFQLFAALSQRRSIPVAHLRPSGKPRANHMAKIEVRNLLRKQWDKLDRKSTR